MPAALAATALIGTVDVLGAPQAYISVGVPPLPSAAAIAAAAFALLLVIAGNEIRGLVLTIWNGTAAAPVPTGTQTAGIHQRGHLGQPDSSKELGPMRNVALLPSSSARVLARENPLNAFAAHSDDSEEHPTSKEDGHEVADKGKPGKAVPGELVRHLQGSHSCGKPKEEHN